MKHYVNVEEFAKDCNIPVNNLVSTFTEYDKICQSKKDPFGKTFFDGAPWKSNDDFNVAIVTPVLHYCMGGLMCDVNAQVLSETGPIDGLYASGEVVGGVHGEQRLGGSSLLDCVVFGRVAGRSVSNYLMREFIDRSSGSQASPLSINLQQKSNGVTIDISMTNQISQQTQSQTPKVKLYTREQPVPSRSSLPLPPGAFTANPSVSTPTTTTVAAPRIEATVTASVSKPPTTSKGQYTLAEVAQHKTEKDCWVVVNDEVLDVTKFLPDHPGGKKAILLYAGKDASEEFNMLHDKNVVAKYAPDAIIGTLKK